jgi:hypothetical protein
MIFLSFISPTSLRSRGYCFVMENSYINNSLTNFANLPHYLDQMGSSTVMEIFKDAPKTG